MLHFKKVLVILFLMTNLLVGQSFTFNGPSEVVLNWGQLSKTVTFSFSYFNTGGLVSPHLINKIDDQDPFPTPSGGSSYMPSSLDLSLSPGNHTIIFTLVSLSENQQAPWTVHQQSSTNVLCKITVKIQNNFIGGSIFVDNYTVPKTSPVNKAANYNLQVPVGAIDQDYENYNRKWNLSGNNQSSWDRERYENGAWEFQSSSRDFTYTVLEADKDRAVLSAGLRTNFRIDQTHKTEFDGDITQQNTSWIVEQHNGSITAPFSKTIGSNNYNFAGWIDNLTLSQTRTINSPTDNQTYTALYKYPHHSNTGSFANSGQRKVIRSEDGYLHLVYESMGYVWYERSTDNGASWDIMNSGKPIDKNPSKSPSIDFYYGYQRLIIVYQTWAGESNEFAAIKAACFKLGQLEFTTTVEQSYLSTYSEVNYKPVVGYASNDKIAVAWEDYGVWVLTGVLSFSTNQISWNNIICVDNYNSANINPTIAAYKTTPGTATFHLAWQNNYSTIRYCNLTAQSNGSFLVSAVDQVSQGCGFPVNYYPSINVSNSNDVQLVWIGTPYYGSSYRKTLSRSRTTNWSSSFAQYGNNVLSPDVAFYTGSSVVSWSENPSSNIYTNKFIKYGSVKTAGTIGRDVRVFNASTLQDMHLVSFTTNSLPYAFTHSANLNNINKDDSLVMASGVQAVAFKEGVEYFFRIGDISLNGSNIDFESFEDTVGVLSLEYLNTNLITNSFTTNETNNLVYSIE